MGTQQDAIKACAPMAGNRLRWELICVSLMIPSVRKLQLRIAKAFREGKRSKVKALQRILTRSWTARLFAVHWVTTNKGKNTSGVDKVLWTTPEQKTRAAQMLKRRGYHSLPLRRIYIPKKNGKLRPLSIPTMNDRAMQALHLLAFLPIAEETADPNSYGFRPHRSTADAIAQCFTVLSRRNSASWILEGDITGCFDHIGHDWLLNHVPMDKEMLRKWLKAGYVEDKRLFPTVEGTPQGGIASPTLANMALDGLEDLLNRIFRRGQKVHYVRYADDFVITGASRELLENEVRPVVEQFLWERGLELSPEKTRVAHIREGFDFLGQNVRKYGEKLLIKPSQKNVTAFLDKVRGILKQAKAWTHDELIRILNPVIRGWANYHRSIVAKATFNHVDHTLWSLIWNWLRHRHPSKSSGWIKKTYFRRIKGRDWIFKGSTGGTLYHASSTPIRRHVKVKSAAHPFDPQWTDYFRIRKDFLKLKGAGEILSFFLMGQAIGQVS